MRSRKSTTRCKAKARGAGRPAVFCRFAGCNLWSGREEDRATATCDFCDTDFVGADGPGGGKFADGDALARACRETWRGNSGTAPFVVLTGGEPMLQVDEPLVAALHAAGFEVAVGTQRHAAGALVHRLGVRQPQGRRALAAAFGRRAQARLSAKGELGPEEVQAHAFTHFLLQPMDQGARSPANVRAAIDYCLAHPKWRLSLQTHKLLGLP